METGHHITFVGTLLPFVGIVFLIALGVIILTQQFRRNLYREQLEQEELKRQHQSELTKSTILVQEQERKRISQDLHDDLGAVLSIIRMHLLQTERKHQDVNDQLPGELQNIRSLTENAIESMRRISHELMPPQLERFGVLETLEQACEQLTAAGKINCVFTAEEQVDSYITDELMSLTLYRVCMELINNTIKHAGATELQLNFSVSDTEIIVHYRDNGKGMIPDHSRKGSGLRNMHNRIHFLGGSAVIQKEQPGFFMTILFPVTS
ncbi:sensor histidine kinase [Crocinitomicaceae bacterium CZZ-1]|uniref:histidine kinase n=1 Tax=Taishania pollutisoli TaxID=2766479 RepID=A0A8J6P6F5_9FLAO|nr:sensor histidine kinase [Taishania pollutisoli]MBC9812767.1 sensor histidine kinase [Taishania pollutisoli]NGF76203.1 sensor histidine kinase [Fluviicola sp. SGL-29]